MCGRDGRTIRLRLSGYAETGNDRLLVRAEPIGRSPTVQASRVLGGKFEIRNSKSIRARYCQSFVMAAKAAL